MRLLVANFFPAHHPPRSGGEQRYYSLYHHLSRRHDVTLLSANYTDKPVEYVEHSPSFREYRVPKPPVSEALHWELYQGGIGDECSGLVVAIAAQQQGVMHARFRELLPYADAVIHECPFTLPYDETAFSDGKPRVYASYNVEHRLAAQMLKGESGAAGTRFIRFLESLLVTRSHLVFATSEEEREQMAADFGVDAARIRLAPNGFEPMDGGEADAPAAREPYVVLLGSGHPPNVEAGRFILDMLAPALPQLEFRIMGAVCGKLGANVAPNVKLLGFVEEARMRAELRGCAAAINPLTSGAGTNLKMLQYMEAGAPILSTAIGARGLDLAEGLEVRVRPLEAFAEELGPLAANPSAWSAMGEAGRAKARAVYAWPSIADQVDQALRTLPLTVSRGTRPRIISVNDYAVTERMGGGQVRIHELLRELARDFDVQLLCMGDARAESEARIAERAHQRVFPKSAAHRKADMEADRDCSTSVRDIVASEWILRNEAFVAAFLATLPHAAAVVFEHPYLAPLLDLVPARMPVIYDSHNCEEDLKAGLLANRRDGPAWAQKAAQLEWRLATRADLIVSVSEADAAKFRARHPGKRVVVIENGVFLGAPRTASAASGTPSAIFVGSPHPPNIEAAMFIVRQLAPSMPETRFDIVGSVCNAIGSDVPANVVLHGVVDDATKRALFAGASVAINPMAHGGGSSLKVPDFLSAGLPLLTTEVGARGFGLRAGRDYCSAELSGFGEALRRLLAADSLLSELSASGRRAVRHVHWGVLGSRYRREMRRLLRGAPRTGRVLVATYRLMEPAPGGAESFLNRLLAHWGARGDVALDAVACDVGTIQDHWHFSARYGLPPPPATPDGVRTALRFAIEPPLPDAFERSRTLHRMWMSESCAQWERLFDRLDAPFLLGGWNWPENSGEAVWRWSGVRAQVGIPAGHDELLVTGTCQGERTLRLVAGERRVEMRLEGPFELRLPLDGERRIAELHVDPPLEAPTDPRELGVAVRRVALRRADAWADLDIRADAEQQLRRADPEGWVDSLIDVTTMRDPAMDAEFLAIRGPHSRAMREWLERHVADYDAVLVQGAPFAPLDWVPRIARAAGVPTVLLPHFHVEDRYYHWQSFYAAFRDADQVIVNSAFVKEALMDKIGARATALPGGGVELDEFGEANLERCAREFRAIHASDKPFVLVLGRKAGGKRYRLVVAAATGQDDFDVVMVGPDEDGLPLNKPNVHYYGARPRDFVLGALRECLCLANMSESESFGIVLLEAWCAGRPVIAQRRCAAFRDLLVDGRNGFLAETAQDVRGLAQRYLKQPELARQHAIQGRQDASRFAWSVVAESINGVVAAAASGSAPGGEAPASSFDGKAFAMEALQETLNLASGDLMHDEDFDAFRWWCGTSVQCVLDIGANRGQSIVSLHRVFPSARIHCFEANPLYHSLLAEVMSRIGVDGVVHPYGLGEREGELPLYIPWAGGRPWLEESSTLPENYEKPWIAERFAQRGGLTLQPLVAAIRRGDDLGLDPQVVKIDVEGAESVVIRGLQETIRRSRPLLLVENSDYHGVTSLLAEWDFHPYRWEPSTRRLVPFHGQSVNTFYVHASSALPIGNSHEREGASA